MPAPKPVVPEPVWAAGAMELPGLVMRRAALVAAVALVLSAVLGFVRAGSDIEDETRAALAMASMLQRLGDAARLSDQAVVQALEAAHRDQPLRHLAYALADADGRVRAATAAPEPAGPLVQPLVELHAAWQGPVTTGSVAWPVQRAAGPPWTLTFTGAHDAERREAMSGLAASLGLAAAGAAAMLLVMALYVRRAFRPLRGLLQGIERLQRGEPGAVAGLPQMPIRELQAIAAALRRLDHALQGAQAERRVLSQKVLTLQEDERQRLAQELHDEFGQRLTALRVDAAWLRRHVDADRTAAAVVDGMVDHCTCIQQDIRALLTRLRPMGALGSTALDPLGRLPALLQPLIKAWQRGSGAAAVHLELRAQAQHSDGAAAPWPSEADAFAMPGELQLAIYRMSQEALTNVARHAQATHALLSLRLRLAPRDGSALLHWSMQDDGVGIVRPDLAMQRGSGLAGLRERAWAHGADLRVEAVDPGAARPGLRLSATFEFKLADIAVAAQA